MTYYLRAVLLVLVFLTLPIITIGKAIAQPIASSFQFNGPVHTLTISESDYLYDATNNRIIETAPRLVNEVTFDENGNKVRQSYYSPVDRWNPDSSEVNLFSRDLFTYDEEGNLLKSAAYEYVGDERH